MYVLWSVGGFTWSESALLKKNWCVRVIGFNKCFKTLTSYLKIDNMISFKIDFKTGRKYFQNELKNISNWCFLHNARDDSLYRYTRDIQGMKVHLVTKILPYHVTWDENWFAPWLPSPPRLRRAPAVGVAGDGRTSILLPTRQPCGKL